ncbi:MAG: ROK family protein [Candidatus Doudnabacteria bacterium]
MKIISIDVGGTTIKYGLYDKGLKDFQSIETPQNSKDFLSAILTIAAKYAGVRKIGLGLPGVVDKEKGKLLNLPNLKFLNNIDVVAYLKKSGYDVLIDNDVKCYMRAEQHHGRAKGKKDAVLLTIGTGIGAAIVIDHKIYYGQGSAGELGHMILDNGKDFSYFASGKSLKQHDKTGTHSKAEFQRIEKYLSYALINILNIFEPEVILLAGGVIRAHHNEFLAKSIKRARAGLIAPKAKKIPILQSELGEKAGVIGAALLF